ncbi:hypothetical protein Nepgr_026525 [Nepenthes gracilis]|uniref:Uncharacterized protein n=1 Tax=Nepenthes gracilis TaxID=150966 RepID=A0AAD3T8F1_NEPGR|nr:hypothetical protein Nepgr_026525 [Nepenthes gracilis]
MEVGTPESIKVMEFGEPELTLEPAKVGSPKRHVDASVTTALQEIDQRETEILPECIAALPPPGRCGTGSPTKGVDILLQPLGMEEAAAPSEALSASLSKVASRSTIISFAQV